MVLSAMKPSCECVLLEPLTGLLQQLGRHGEIPLGSTEIHMTEVSGKRRKKALNISALLVPGDKPVDRKRMPQVMDSGLVGREVVARDSGMAPEPLETLVHGLQFDRLRPFALKHVLARRVPASRIFGLSSCKMLGKNLASVQSNRHQSGFVKLRLFNPDNGACQIDVQVFKAERFAQTQSGSVEEQKRGV
jgi:hypothetical protein